MLCLIFLWRLLRATTCTGRNHCRQISTLPSPTPLPLPLPSSLPASLPLLFSLHASIPSLPTSPPALPHSCRLWRQAHEQLHASCIFIGFQPQPHLVLSHGPISRLRLCPVGSIQVNRAAVDLSCLRVKTTNRAPSSR